MPSSLQPPHASTLDARTHYLYRLFGATEDLLYVGIAVDPGMRLYIHRREKPWWPEVSRSALSTYPTRADAEYREAHAILTEHPRYNLAIPTLARLDALWDRVTQDYGALTAEGRIEILEYQLRRMSTRSRTAEAEVERLKPLEARLKEAEARLAAVEPEEFRRKIAQAEYALLMAERHRADDRRAWLVEIHKLEEQLRSARGASAGPKTIEASQGP
jgi:hypothetical protein